MIRTAQLIASAVEVLCPHCGEPQPNHDDGSYLWTKDDFLKKSGAHHCASCDMEMKIIHRSTVKFE